MKSINERKLDAQRIEVEDFLARVDFQVHHVMRHFWGHVVPVDLVILIHPEQLHEIHVAWRPNDTRLHMDRERGPMFVDVRIVSDHRVPVGKFRVMVDFDAIDGGRPHG